MGKLIRTAAVLLAGGVLAAGCGDDGDAQEARTDATPPARTSAVPTPPANRQLEALVAAPAQFADERITVTGEAAGATTAPAAFKLIKPRGSERNGIVVLATETARNARDVVTNDVVTVEGTVMEVTPELADRAAFLFESRRDAADVLDGIDSDYVLAADRVVIE